MAIGTGIQFEGAVKPDAITVDSYEPDLFAKRIVEVPSNMQMRADYGASTDGLPDYMGYAPKGLASSADGWLLQKFTYDANRQCTLRQISYSSWDLRATAVYD
jgi:hypothetical protein